MTIHLIKRVVLLALIPVLIFLGAFGLLLNDKPPYSEPPEILWDDYTVIEYELENRRLKLVVADSPEKWQKGLMYVRKPVQGFDGMIFRFPKKEKRTFWNKNTFEDLDIYWLDGEGITGKDMLPSIEKTGQIVVVSSDEPADTVIEVVK